MFLKCCGIIKKILENSEVRRLIKKPIASQKERAGSDRQSRPIPGQSVGDGFFPTGIRREPVEGKNTKYISAHVHFSSTYLRSASLSKSNKQYIEFEEDKHVPLIVRLHRPVNVETLTNTHLRWRDTN